MIGTVDTGDFQNLLPDRFGTLWTGTETETDTTHAWDFSFGLGAQFPDPKECTGLFVIEYQVLAVRNGDVLATV